MMILYKKSVGHANDYEGFIMKKNRLLALLLSAVLLLSLLAGCGGKPSSNPDPTKDPGSQQTDKPAAPVEL